MDSVLAKDYPSPVRELYTGVLRKDRPSERHHQLLRLGEASLTYLAALAFADYRRLRGDDPVPRWLGFWEHFVEYRNRVIHADDKSWPVDAVGYYEVMTPLLESALVEALRTEYIAHVLLEYPVARLLSVERSYGAWTLRFDGEHRGAPLITQVSTESPPHAWQSELDRKYILTRANGGWTVYSRFYDLRAGELPSPLRPGQTPSPDGEEHADDPSAWSDRPVGQVAPRESPAVEPTEVPARMETPLAAEHGQPLRSTAANGAVGEPEVATTAADAPRRASWARRAAALGLDQLSMWTITLAVLFPSILIFGENSAVPLLFLVAGFLVALVLVGIVPLRRGPREGQTFGKQVLDVRVVPEPAGSLSSPKIVVRELLLKNLLFGLPSVFLLGVPALVNYLWPLWDRRSRTLHDHLCATRVLSDLPA